MSFEESAYGPVFAQLLNVDRQRALDEGAPDLASSDRLRSLSLEEAFAHTRVIDPDMARCCLSAVCLLYDLLGDSHTISQSIATAEGSFWHGIMHRREGDFSNAKYWFRKVGDHPVYEKLTEEDSATSGVWDPFEFVDACQAALQTGGADAERCQQLQLREWELLFDYCYQEATASN